MSWLDKPFDDMTPDERRRMSALAKVGMTAVVDEATGYQDERPDGALARRHADLGGDEADYRAPDDLSVPYPLFCRHAEKCAGLNSCPRERACDD